MVKCLTCGCGAGTVPSMGASACGCICHRDYEQILAEVEWLRARVAELESDCAACQCSKCLLGPGDFDAAIDRAAAQEREECAALCESIGAAECYDLLIAPASKLFAEAIRARGGK